MIAREQAEQALTAVKEQFRMCIDAGEPQPIPVKNCKS